MVVILFSQEWLLYLTGTKKSLFRPQIKFGAHFWLSVLPFLSPTFEDLFLTLYNLLNRVILSRGAVSQFRGQIIATLRVIGGKNTIFFPRAVSKSVLVVYQRRMKKSSCFFGMVITRFFAGSTENEVKWFIFSVKVLFSIFLCKIMPWLSFGISFPESTGGKNWNLCFLDFVLGRWHSRFSSNPSQLRGLEEWFKILTDFKKGICPIYA